MRKWKELAIGMLAVMLAGVSAVPQSVCAADTGERTQILSAGIGTKLLQQGNSKGIALTSAVFKDGAVLYTVMEYDADRNGYLSKTEVLAIQNINIPRYYVEDVSGIEKLTSLREVHLGHYSGTSIKLGKSVEKIIVDDFDAPSIRVSGSGLREVHLGRYSGTSIKLDKSVEKIIIDGFDAPSIRVSGSGLRHMELHGWYPESEIVVDVSACKHLQSLLIEDVDISKLRLPKKGGELKELIIIDSKLTSINLKNASYLKILKIRGSKLKEIDLSKNTKLVQLECSFGKLTSLDCSKNKALKTLNCEGNKLASLDLSNNTKLTALNCYGNKLDSLNLSKNKALKTLSCGGNELTSLDLSENKKLTRVDCYKNPLQELNIKGKTYAYSEIKVTPEIVSVTPQKPRKIDVVLKSQDKGNQYLVRQDYFYQGENSSLKLSDDQPSGEVDVVSKWVLFCVDILGGKEYDDVMVYTGIAKRIVNVER